MIRTIFAIVIFLAATCTFAADPPKEPAKPSANMPGEELLKGWSPDKAADFLDGVSLHWTREKKCGTCHTNYPYLMARPRLQLESDMRHYREVRAFFEDRALNWDKNKPRWDAEVVATAVSLAISDRHTTNKLHAATQAALARMWKLQKENGSWDWLKCDWPPMEHDDYFGVVYAAVGIGIAPGNYSSSPIAQAGLEKMRGYLKKNQVPDLHHKTWLLWASYRIPDFLSDSEKKAAIAELRSKQREDGGWSLPSLGSYKRRDGTDNDPKADSDGYATGLVLCVLKEAGLEKDDEAIRKGIHWLQTHQTESGRWYTRSLNNDKAHYITNAGTAFAVWALRSWE
jgi:squalene-hopene/tetraprenyl-beta-curcumene cyclase